MLEVSITRRGKLVKRRWDYPLLIKIQEAAVQDYFPHLDEMDLRKGDVDIFFSFLSQTPLYREGYQKMHLYHPRSRLQPGDEVRMWR